MDFYIPELKWSHYMSRGRQTLCKSPTPKSQTTLVVPRTTKTDKYLVGFVEVVHDSLVSLEKTLSDESGVAALKNIEYFSTSLSQFVDTVLVNESDCIPPTEEHHEIVKEYYNGEDTSQRHRFCACLYDLKWLIQEKVTLSEGAVCLSVETTDDAILVSIGQSPTCQRISSFEVLPYSDIDEVTESEVDRVQWSQDSFAEKLSGFRNCLRSQFLDIDSGASQDSFELEGGSVSIWFGHSGTSVQVQVDNRTPEVEPPNKTPSHPEVRGPVPSRVSVDTTCDCCAEY